MRRLFLVALVMALLSALSVTASAERGTGDYSPFPNSQKAAK
jgi:hypothetical protein